MRSFTSDVVILNGDSPPRTAACAVVVNTLSSEIALLCRVTRFAEVADPRKITLKVLLAMNDDAKMREKKMPLDKVQN